MGYLMKRLATRLLMACGMFSGALAAQPVDSLGDGRSGDIDFASLAPGADTRTVAMAVYKWAASEQALTLAQFHA